MPQNFNGGPLFRIVQGNPHEPSLTDQNGQPRVVKSGPNTGQPSPQWYIAGACAKNDPEWPAFHAMLYAEARAAWPHLFDAVTGACIKPDFAWKIEDGDDTTPKYNAKTQKTTRNCDREGWAGHWIVKFTSGFPPTFFEQPDPSKDVFLQLGEEAKTRVAGGDYVKISGNTQTNGSPQTPGIFVNHRMVLIVAKGQPITSGPDAQTAFGGSSPTQLPPGATPLPPAAFTPPPGAGAPPIPQPPPGHAIAPPGGPVTAPPAAPMTPDSTLASASGAMSPSSPPPVPYTGYMQPGAGGPPPAPAAPAPAPPPVPVGPVMLPAANGVPYASYIAQGWTDDQLRQHGMMQ